MSKKSMPRDPIARFWHFLWYDDSILSWVVNIILAFVLIRFLVYPGLGFVLGTPYPVVAVVSESMEHSTGLAEWWDKDLCCNSQCSLSKKPSDFYPSKEILFSDFSKFPLKNGFNKGDIMILVKPEDLKVGDVLVFKSSRPDPIIHRIVDAGNKYGTKGDNNCEQIKTSLLDETNIQQQDLIGKAVIRLPFLGWVKILFVDLIDLLR